MNRMSQITGIPYHQIAIELTRAGPAADSPLVLHVVGNSMVPLLRAGDRVMIQSVELVTLRRGDLVVVQRAGEWVTHRLVEVNALGWHTKGDSVRCADSPVLAEAIQGRVVAIERNGKRIDLQSRRWLAVNRWLGGLGWLEAQVFRAARRLKTGLMGTESRPWLSTLASLTAIPFRVLIRLLVGLTDLQ
jgi:hypothetical protein